MPDYAKGKRVNIYLSQEREALLRQIAQRYHGGNASEAITAALDAYIERMSSRADLVREAVAAMAAAVEPDERYDPDDDLRAEAPHLLLAALFGEADARAIEDALVALAEMRLTAGRYESVRVERGAIIVIVE